MSEENVMPYGQPVLILSGAPGTGKTTVARHIAATAERAVHLESDCFFHFIEAGYIEPWRAEAHEQNTLVMRVVATAAATYAQAGYFTIIEGIISPAWFFAPVRDRLRESGCRVAYAILRAPLPVCIERSADEVSGGGISADVIKKLWHDFADLDEMGHHVVEIGSSDPDDLASRLVGRLRTGELDV